MFSTIQDPHFKQEADVAINQFCPDVHELTYVEHGADNIVALVNQSYVFRFPRNEIAAKRLAFETALLQKIGNKMQAVAVPHIQKVATRPLYTVADYIPGEHLTGQQIQSLSQEEQVTIGRTIAKFVAELNQAVSGLEVRRLRIEAAVEGVDEPWPQYFERLFVKTPLPNEKLRPIINDYYARWNQNIHQEQATYAIHDDLHPSNILFLGPRMSGVVDFGDANMGSIESELRWLYLMGDVVLNSATEYYQQLTGIYVDAERARVWAIMHELSSFTDRLAKQQTNTYPFTRARDNLRLWVPSFPM